jgi:hypothetical protein
MSYEVKYRVEFASLSNIQWKIEILEDDFSGSITDLLATGDPLHLEYNSDSDAFNEPIRTSKAVFNVYSFTDFELIDFYTDQDFRLKVNIYKNDAINWTGWIITGEYGEPYDPVPYPVKITAIDGLSYLKDILYADSVTVSEGDETIVYWEGRMVESRILLDILGKIQITGFREYVNIFADEMLFKTINDSPIEQSVLDTDVFRDMKCWDVLLEILRKYNAVLRQKDGEFVIYRPSELSQSVVYGRIFTAWNTKTSTAYIPDQQIERAGITSGLRQFPGSQLMIKRPAKKITINQDYGYKMSFINNYDLKGNTFTKIDDSTFTLQNWTKSHTDLIRPSTMIGEAEGVLLFVPNAYPTLDHHLSQSFGDFLIASSNVGVLSFEYLIFNKSNTNRTGEVLYVEVKADNASKYLYGYNEETCAWSNSLTRIALTMDAPVGSTGWNTFKRSVPGLPVDGPYTIKLFSLNDAYADVYILFKNIRFYATSDEIVGRIKSYKERTITYQGNTYTRKKFDKYISLIKDNIEVVEKKYILSNSIAGIDLNADYMLGDVVNLQIDNVIEQFAGSIAVNANSILPSTKWNTISPGGEDRPLLEITGGEIGLQYSRPRQFIQMEIKDNTVTIPYTGYGILYNWFAARGIV